MVAKIDNLGKTPDERAMIAITIVQIFEYKNSSKTIDFHGISIQYARYPYEVLYDEQGICGEKSELLAFILKQMGYEVVLFYFPNENHEGVGVKCHSGDFRKTGYCYIETTGVFPVGTDPKSLLDTGNLADTRIGDFSDYQIIKISSGKYFD